MKTTRRGFLASSAGIVSALALSRYASAEATKLDENDPLAKQMGYTHDASTVDKAKQPKFVEGEDCGNCNFYQGAEGSEWGGCPIFGGKDVAAKGWCSAYVKKA